MRVWVDNDNLFFCGVDIATALGYKNTKDALLRHCREDGVVFYDLTDNIGREQKTKFITEGNVYRLIVHSKLPDGYILQGFRRKRLQTLRFSLLAQPDFNFTMIILEECNT